MVTTNSLISNTIPSSSYNQYKTQNHDSKKKKKNRKKRKRQENDFNKNNINLSNSAIKTLESNNSDSNSPPSKRSRHNKNGNVTQSYNQNKKESKSFSSQDSQSSFAAIQKQRKELPMYNMRDELMKTIHNNTCTIIVGETGSGKTTQVPQYLYEQGFSRKGRIGCTQPRRVAAVTVSERVSQEMGVPLGNTVGYSIRFEDTTSPQTRVKYMTDGMLVREAELDASLSAYSVLIVDEAHERTLHTDVAVGVVKRALQLRKGSLKVVVMSATLEARSFSSFFNDAPVVYVRGRQHAVDVMYTAQPQADYVDAAVTAVMQVHLEESEGDVLTFLTGQDEIDAVGSLLEHRARSLPASAKALVVRPMYAALPKEKQMQAFQRLGNDVRKVVLATNIAETSVTIPGIRFVIDTGLAKTRNTDPNTGLESLAVAPISMANAQQRAGRAGREASGKCFRLYTEDTYHRLRKFGIPEIRRCGLATICLQLKAMGIDSVTRFPFMDPPPRAAIIRALQHLLAVGALSKTGSLTELGQRMARLPLEPTFALALLKSDEFGCVSEMLSICAMLSVDNVFFTPYEQRDEASRIRSKFSSIHGDHFYLLSVFEQFEESQQSSEWCRSNFINYRAMLKVIDVRRQLEAYLADIGIYPMNSDRNYSHGRVTHSPAPLHAHHTSQIRRCLTSAFFLNAARRVRRTWYRTIQEGQEVRLHPSSCLLNNTSATTLPDVIVFTQMVKTSKTFVRDVCAVEPDWLVELAPNTYRKSSNVDENNTDTTTQSQPHAEITP
eukprot:gb/GECH01001519.1/.p1 GENE.gb/GECH01001519.1/~~gb/GECH01001519.1/.p1  ORF type:complete len:779 (+),score=163.76 gb/GECH01001519.1/:1-2337(+)